MQLLKATVALFLVFNLVSSMVIRANASTAIEEMVQDNNDIMEIHPQGSAIMVKRGVKVKGRKFADDIEPRSLYHKPSNLTGI